MDFQLLINNLDGNRVINFANNTKKFVEVIFAIDGKEVKNGLVVSDDTKGYGYPPKLEKPVKKMKDGSALKFNSRGGEVVAYVYEGEGSYKDEDLIKPAFLRHQMVDKVRFKRTAGEPLKILRIKY